MERIDLPEDLTNAIRVIDEIESTSKIPWRPRDYSTGKGIVDRFFPTKDEQRTLLAPLNMNVIPSDEIGPCHKTLFVAVGYNDDCEKRILEAVEHVSSNCPGKTRYVVFYAAWWDSKAWLSHAQSFKKHNCLVILKNIRQSVMQLK